MNAQRMVLMVTSAAYAFMLSQGAVGASPEACGVLTQSEVTAALGVAVDAGERLMPNDMRFCTWREHGKDRMQARNVQVSFISERQYDVGKTPVPSITKTPESGLGDEAYFSKGKGMVFNLSVKKGDSYFRVMVRSNPDVLVKGSSAASDEKDKEIDRAIAREILKKL